MLEQTNKLHDYLLQSVKSKQKHGATDTLLGIRRSMDVGGVEQPVTR